MCGNFSERRIHFNLSRTYDCRSLRRVLRRSRRNRLWHLSSEGFDIPERIAPGGDGGVDERRRRMFTELAGSGQFTPTQLATIQALAFERLTVRELAARQGVSRQAIAARLRGNSRHQGGILRRAGGVPHH